MNTLKISYVDDNAELARWAECWQQESVLGIDTEFIRTQTFYPRAGLFQISSSQGEFLVDPLKITDFDPLRAMLTNTNILKVLHAGSEDLELFQCFLGVLPAPLFDTQIAAAFLGKGLSVGYQKLVEAELEASLPNSETRSDWLQRPLTESQIHYAGADVHFLLPLYQSLQAQLEQKGMEEPFREECDSLVRGYREVQDPNRYFLKLRGAWHLSRTRQRVLQQLCAWREQEARDRDQPRSHVMTDAVIIEIAQNQPKTTYELSQIPGITHRQLKNMAESVLEIVRKSQVLGALDVADTIPRPLSKRRKVLFQRLRDRVRQIAVEQDLPDSLLVKKNVLEQLAATADVRQQQDKLPVTLLGWRERLLAEPLLRELNAYIAEQSDESHIDLQESP